MSSTSVVKVSASVLPQAQAVAFTGSLGVVESRKRKPSKYRRNGSSTRTGPRFENTSVLPLLECSYTMRRMPFFSGRGMMRVMRFFSLPAVKASFCSNSSRVSFSANWRFTASITSSKGTARRASGRMIVRLEKKFRDVSVPKIGRRFTGTKMLTGLFAPLQAVYSSYTP